MKRCSVLLLGFVLALLGIVIAGCNEKEGFVPPKMPETPNVSYNVKGYVFGEGGMPLQNIRVVICYKEGDIIPGKGLDDVYTDSNGYYDAGFTGLLRGTLYIEFVDEKCVYARAGSFYYVKYTSDKEYWYKGIARVSADMTLKKLAVETE